MKIFGKIIWKGEKQVGTSQTTGENWYRQDAMIQRYHENANGTFSETQEKIVISCGKLELLQSKTWQEALDPKKPDVGFGLFGIWFDGRLYNGRYYQDARVTSIVPQELTPANTQKPAAAGAQAPAAVPTPPTPQGDDLPF